MLHNETRKLLIEAWNKTHNAKEVAECFSVNASTVYRLIPSQSDITIHEIREKLRLQVSDETVRKAVLKLGYVYKKKSLHASQAGASPMSGPKGKHGKNIYRRAA